MYTFLYFLNTQNGTFKNDKNREFHIRNIYIYFTIFKKPPLAYTHTFYTHIYKYLYTCIFIHFLKI